MALGAVDAQVVRLVVRDGLVLGIAGVLAGLPLALLATRLSASLLVGIDPWDLPVFAGAAVVLLSGVWLATMIPAFRAARVEPSSALRG
jgi:ABC-type lipoprotein release transport system permease subunit